VPTFQPAPEPFLSVKKNNNMLIHYSLSSFHSFRASQKNEKNNIHRNDEKCARKINPLRLCAFAANNLT